MQTFSPISELAAELWHEATSNWQGYDHWANSEDYILGSPRVRQLGEQANRIGGFEAMAAVVDAAFYSRIRDNDPAAPLASCGVSEINHAWHGIGDWQA